MATMAIQSQLPQPLAPMSDLHRQDSNSTRPRKLAPTGGNRSWSEEEETYLLQTRAQKMPYKHIAAHLKKTELACRLHYHQLSHGSHRRKRTSSLSSTSSSGGSVRHSPPQYHLNGDPHDDYRNAAMHGYSSYGSLNPLAPYAMATNLGSRPQHKVLLPKPRPLSPDDSPNRMQGLRINTLDGSPHQGQGVDRDRLRNIYDSRRGSFWSSIAQEYGSDVSPNHLEELWRQHPAGHPPTPDGSPDGRSAIHPMLQPSPFPPYAPPIQTAVKDFAPMSLQSNDHSPTDRYSYMTTPQTSYSGPSGASYTNASGTTYTNNSGTNYTNTPGSSFTSTSSTNYANTPGTNYANAPSTSYSNTPGTSYTNPASTYTNIPSLTDLSRTTTWPGSVTQPATAITSLLTEDKCPRHTDTRYCAGRCI